MSSESPDVTRPEEVRRREAPRPSPPGRPNGLLGTRSGAVSPRSPEVFHSPGRFLHRFSTGSPPLVRRRLWTTPPDPRRETTRETPGEPIRRIGRIASGGETMVTVATSFRDTVRRTPDAVALRWKAGDGWAEWTWADYADRACRVAAALSGLGVVQGERVVLMMRNRPEFHVADMATLLLGATPVSIYNSSAPEQVQYLVQHCGAVCAIVEDVDYLERVLKVRDELPALAHVVVIDDDDRAPDDVLRWDALLEAEPRRPRRGGEGREARRPRDDHLHVGHDRSAEGRDARPRQHRLDRRQPAPGAGRGHRGRGQPDGVVPADGAHRRAHDLALPGRDASATR